MPWCARLAPLPAGGELDLPPGAPLRLRLFLDGSCLEVITGTGQALTTRVYRGHPPSAEEGTGGGGGPDAGLELLAVGGGCCVDDLHAYEVGSGWLRAEDEPGAAAAVAAVEPGHGAAEGKDTA